MLAPQLPSLEIREEKEGKFSIPDLLKVEVKTI
jgi:hypothetical protein